MQHPHRRLIAASSALGLTWVIVVAVSAVASLLPSNGMRSIASLFLPAAVTPFVWSAPIAWSLALPTAGAIAVAACHAALVALSGGQRTASTARLWLAAVAAGAACGLTLDVQAVFGSLIDHGFASWSLGLGSRAATGAYWGLLYGWIAAVVAGAVSRDSATAAAPPGQPRRAIWAAVAVLALVVLVVSQSAGHAATQAAAIERETAERTNIDEGGAVIDPTAEGDDVPDRSPGAGTIAPDGCSDDVAMLLLGTSGAATGHRGQSITLMNFSDRPCVIEGYPDVAFADQNGHALEVTVTSGRSFMAEDPGPSRIEVPPNGEAIAFLGWDAASTHDALVARTLFAARTPGDPRGSWPVMLDIVSGSEVAVTAWELRAPGMTDSNG